MSVLGDRVAWGYASSADTEDWYGANDRETAIDEAAQIAFDQDSAAYITEGRWVSAEKCALLALSADEFLTRMDEVACDNEVSSDDEIFDAEPSAIEELERIVGEWAEKHVNVRRSMATDFEPIPVNVCRAPVPADQATPTNWTDDEGVARCCEYLIGADAVCQKHPAVKS